jgi:hypothetical protein
MKSHLCLFVVHQRINWVCPQKKSLALPCPLRRAGPAGRGKSGDEDEREVSNEERCSGHWCGPEQLRERL